MQDFFKRTVEEVKENLKVGQSGLKTKEAKRRLLNYGENILKEKKKVNPVTLFIKQFKGPIMAILIFAVIISVLIGHNTDAVVIAIILVGNAIFGFVQEYKAEEAISALKKLSTVQVKVKRDNKVIKIPSEELVPGDIVLLDAGDKVPADIRLTEVNKLDIMESVLTGESRPVHKDIAVIGGGKELSEQSNMAFSGTLVTAGHGEGVVVRTGMNTEIGKIASMIENAEEKVTPLQRDLASLGKWLGIATVGICFVIFLVQYLVLGTDIIETFMAALSLAVAAIPEGLPAVVTISLALGVQRMAKKNTLVRRLPSVETLGCCSVICSDKTGTLTHNEMTVKRVFVDDKVVNVSGEGYNRKGSFGEKTDGLKQMLQIGALCNNAEFDKNKLVGDPTEGALLISAEKAGIDISKLKGSYKRVDEVPFDSKYKYMITQHQNRGYKYSYMKGAPEAVVERCNKILIDGRTFRFTDKQKKKVLDKNHEFANDALRVLGFAYKEEHKGFSKDDFVFVGLQGMIDPPRNEAKIAIKKCKSAGIKVVMITGDNEVTAKAIADKLGIEGEVLNGKDLDKVKDLSKIVENIGVYARVDPEHKMKIVDALERNKHVIAMTGDGVNDSPALKDADIGIAVGSGTDVAKEASEVILLDDNFSSIVKAVEEGRIIYNNIKKFVYHLLSTNFGEVLLLFITSLLGMPLPMIALQILWVNLVTDGLPALALGVDPGSSEVMKEKPRKIDSKIMDKKMVFNIGVMGLFVALSTLFVFHVGRSESIEVARTLAFTTIVVLELVIVQIIRKDYGESFFGNRWLLWAIGSSFVLQLIVVYIPQLAEIFGTQPLGLIHWMYIAIIAVLLIGFSQIMKLVRQMVIKSDS